MTKFQLIFIGILILTIFTGVIIFATSKLGGSDSLSPVTLWGTMSALEFNGYLEKIKFATGESPRITYVEKSRASFDRELIEAIASNKGPDMILLPHDLIMRFADKVVPIPYSTFSERTFKDTFVEEGELFLSPTGALALPFTIDPLVMYWNRDVFSSASLALPPKLWGEFADLAVTLTEKDTRLNITKSALAFGEFTNIVNAKEILSALIFGAGNPITSRGPEGIRTVLSDKLGATLFPAQVALDFYTQFSNPAKTVYSWNRALPSSKNFFTSGDLAIYIGFASELSDIYRKNQNLNFDVAPLPQARDARVKTTYGTMQGIAILRTSPYIADAYSVAGILVSSENLALFSEVTGLPPVLRDLLANKPTNPIQVVFYNAALQARGWLDPEPMKTSAIFKDMIESLSSGRLKTSEAVRKAHSEIELLFTPS